MPTVLRHTLVWLAMAGIASDGASAPTIGGALPGTAQIAGKIVGADGHAPVAEARVLAYHLTTQRVFTSAPAKSNGKYEIGELPYGYFDLAVETPQGLWLADRAVNLAPAGKVELTLALGSGSAGAGLAPDRTWPGGSQANLVGEVEVRKAPRGRDFWSSPKGIALLTGGVVVALLALASSGGDDDAADPVVP